jgi:hypothetical protein
VDFISQFCQAAVMALVPISLKINSMAKYFIYGPLVIFAVIYLLEYKYTFKCCERVFVLITEGIIIAVYSLYMFNYSYISTNNVDLFGLALVLLL